MPVDKGGERGEQGSPDDWARIGSERSERDALGRKHDETHDPGEEFEQAARPLPADYGSHRPKHPELTEAQKEELEATYGRPIEELLALRENDPRNIHHGDEHDTMRRGEVEQNAGEQPSPLRTEHRESDHPESGATKPADHGGRDALSEVAEGLRSGRLTPDQAADRLEAYQAAFTNGPSADRPAEVTAEQALDTETDAHETTEQPEAEGTSWDAVEGVKPDRDRIHVSDLRRIHILDGDGFGAGGHFAGTGYPGKTEFPETWDDEKIIEAIEDVARNPDYPPETGRAERWEAVGTRDEVEIRAIVKTDGTILTGYPEAGTGVIRNDKYGNPRTVEQ